MIRSYLNVNSRDTRTHFLDVKTRYAIMLKFETNIYTYQGSEVTFLYTAQH